MVQHSMILNDGGDYKFKNSHISTSMVVQDWQLITKSVVYNDLVGVAYPIPAVFRDEVPLVGEA